MSSSESRRPVPALLVVAGALAALVLGGLAVSRLSTSDEGPARPRLTVSVSFPTSAEAGGLETAEITVTNAGSAKVDALFVSFSLVGGGGEVVVPDPLVQAGTGAGSSIVAVRPEPAATGGGVRFGFGSLAAGESTTIEFDLRVPDVTGTAANSVQVYDGRDPDIAAGARLTTEVQ
jgi:energy-converting hydrogenase Eha subunit A